jgi:hypothetical protein
VGEGREGARLFRGVDRAQLRRLREGDDARLDVVLVARAVEGRLDGRGRELAVAHSDGDELAAREPLRRAALVHVDV